MRNTLIAGLVLIALGIAGLAFSTGPTAAAPRQGPALSPQRGIGGGMHGWGAMPGHMSGMGNHMGRWGQSAPTGSAPSAVAGAPTIEVTAVDFGLRPAQIRIRAGQTVNLALANRGVIVHDLTIPALQFHLAAQPGQRAVGSLTVPRPGTYDIYCTIAGHREAGMAGRLVVVP
jgi:plastocyanin